MCLLITVIVSPLVVVVVRRRCLVSFFLSVASIFFFIFLLEVASEDNDEARHMIVVKKEEEEAGYAIVADHGVGDGRAREEDGVAEVGAEGGPGMWEVNDRWPYGFPTCTGGIPEQQRVRGVD